MTLPPGMRLAENRSRGMALLFDFAIVLIIATVCQYIIPGLVQSDYRDNVDKMGVLRDLKTAQTDVNDANAAIKDAERAASRAQASGTTQDARAAQADRRAAIEDKQTAQRDINKILRDANNDAVKLGNSVTQSVREAPNTTGDIANAPAFYSVDALERKADAVSDDIAPATWIAFGTAGVLALLYLVPMTARSGHTLGMRGRGIKVVRVDGSPVTWGAAFIRFFVPVALAVALFPVLSTLGFFAALGLVLWGYRDRNRQGVHDKMARTLVVDA